MRPAIIFSLICLVCTILWAQDETSSEIKIILKDGSILNGQIIEQTAELIRFRTTGGVELQVRRDQIEKIVYPEKREEAISADAEYEYQIGDHELFIMPTAFTMKAGQFYFANYELIFLNYTYAPTNSTHIGAFTLFPIVAEFLETITFGLKQKFLDYEVGKAALWLTYTPKPNLITFGTVFSSGSGPAGLHLGISAANSLDRDDENKDQWELIYLIGVRHDVSKKVALIAEWTNTSSAAENDITGLISFGLRFKGESISWDLAGMRPLQGSGNLVLFPFVKATILLD
jgi:hypothetical protein